MTATYDCASGTVTATLTPVTPFGFPAMWIINPTPGSNTFFPFDTSLTFSSVFPASYTVTAFEAGGAYTTHTFCVTFGTCPGANSFAITPADCNGANGSICVTDATLMPFTIFCDGIPYTNTCATGIGAGGYNCILVGPTNLGIQNTYVNLYLYVPSNAFNANIVEPAGNNCGGGFSITPTGGTPPFTFSWSGPSWLIIGSTFMENTSITGGYGQICCTVTDAVECTIQDCVYFTGSGCAADLDNSGSVTTPDLLLFMGAFGNSNGGCADFDGNGVVNVIDLIIFTSGFGLSGC